MNPILFLVFLVSPVACHISLRRYGVDEAHQAAQWIFQTLERAYATNDKALFLSVFDKSYSSIICGHSTTYSDLEKKDLSSDPIRNQNDIHLTNAVLTGDVLTIEFKPVEHEGEERMQFIAKKIGGAFKIVSFNIIGMKCPAKQQLSSSEDISGCPQLLVNILLNTSADRNRKSTCLATEAAETPEMNDVICVLASQSPNRLKLLQQIGFKNILVRVSNFEENLPKTLPPPEFVVETARGKLSTIVEEMHKKQEPYTVIIAADTVIEFQGEIIGKPEDPQDAINTLKRLRNETHNVYTGVALHFRESDEVQTFFEKTVVHFGDIPDRTIQQYVDSGEPLKKAGSYGIGEFGAVFVRGIEGCMPNVVGLPLHRLHQALLDRKIL